MSLVSQIAAGFSRVAEEINTLRSENGTTELARAEVTSGTPSNSNITTYADITGMSITFTVGSKPVDVHVHLPACYMTAAGSFWVAIRTSANVMVNAYSQGRAVNIVDSFDLHKHLTTPGTYTYKVSFFGTAGVANILFGTTSLSGNAVGFIAAYER